MTWPFLFALKSFPQQYPQKYLLKKGETGPGCSLVPWGRPAAFANGDGLLQTVHPGPGGAPSRRLPSRTVGFAPFSVQPYPCYPAQVHHQPFDPARPWRRRQPYRSSAQEPITLVGLLPPPRSQCFVRQIFHNFFFQPPPGIGPAQKFYKQNLAGLMFSWLSPWPGRSEHAKAFWMA